MAQLKAQITRVRQINPDKQTSWMYITGGGSGAGLLLLVVIGILIWRCKYPKVKKSSSLPHVTYSFTDPENSNMVYSKLGDIRAKKGLAFCQETVEIQDPVSNMRSGFEMICSLPTPQLSCISWKPVVLMSVSIAGG